MHSRAVLDHPQEIKKGKKTSRLPIMPFLQDAKKRLEIPIKKEQTRPTKINVERYINQEQNHCFIKHIDKLHHN